MKNADLSEKKWTETIIIKKYILWRCQIMQQRL